MHPRLKDSAFYGLRIERKAREKRGDKELIEKFRKDAKNRAMVFAGFSLDLLKEMRTGGHGKVVFLGRGMRPLCETVKKMNHALKAVKQNRIRYFIYNHYNYRQGEAVDALIQTGIADSATRHFLIVDFVSSGKTMQQFKKELELAVKKASGKNAIIRMGPYSRTAVDESEFFPHPVDRTVFVKKGVKRVGLDRNTKNEAALRYLILQEAIAREVEKTAENNPFR